MRQHGNRSARRAAALVSFTVTACVLPPDRDLPLATDEGDAATTDRGGGGGGGGGAVVDMTHVADVNRGGGDAAVVAPPRPDAAVVEPPTPDGAVVVPPTPDGAVVVPPMPDAAVVAPPMPDAAPPVPDAGVVVSPDAAAVEPPTPDAAVVEPPTPDAAVVVPDAGLPVPDAATPDAGIVEPPTPDAAVIVPDAGLPVPDAAVVVMPDAGPVCGSLGCLTVDEGEIDLRNRVARILGHLAACGPAIDPAAAVEIRLDDARYTLPAGSLQRVSGRLEGCVGADCAEPNSMPVARAVFRPGFGGIPEGVVVNGTSIRAPEPADDPFSTASVGVSAIAYAAAINDSRCITGVRAIPGEAAVAALEPVEAGELTAFETLILNDVPVPPVFASDLDAGGDLVNAITAISDRTGVEAALQSDGRLLLTSPDGRNIHVVVPSENVERVTGFSRWDNHWAHQANVYLHALAPFHVWSEWSRRTVAAISTQTDDTHLLEVPLVDPIMGAEPADSWAINDVTVRRPLAEDDGVSTFDRERSAIAYANAINERTHLHGVRARALPTVIPIRPFGEIRDGAFGYPPVVINGVAVPDLDFRSGDANGAFAAAINSIAAESGAELAIIDGRPFIVARDGRNLAVDFHGEVSPTRPFQSRVTGNVELVGDDPIRLERRYSWMVIPQSSIAPTDRFHLPTVEFAVDPGTGEYALDVADDSIACVTPLDGVDVTLDVGALRGASFIPTQIVAPSRYAGTWPYCE